MNGMYVTVQALLADPDVTDVVGNRIEIITAPQSGALPDIIVNQITNMDTMLVTGPGGYPNIRVRVECRATTKSGAIGLGDLVIARLSGLRGTFAGMDVTSFLPAETDETDHDAEFTTFRRMLDFYVRLRAA